MTERAILVGVDASNASQFAVAWATREAAARGIGLHIIHAADERAYGLWLAPDSVLNGLRELAQPTLLKAQAHATSIDPTVPVTGQVIIGPPGEVLARRAPKYEMVVVGKHSGATVSHLPGSVPRHLVGDAASPTIVVGTTPEDDHAAIARVVVAVGDRVDESVHWAFQQAQRMNVPLLAIHTWRVTATPPLGMSVAQAHPAALSARSLDEAQRAINAIRGEYPDVSVWVRTSEGTPAHVVPALCRPDDLLVIGHQRPTHKHLHHVGAVAAASMREAPCAVAIIPTTAHKDGSPSNDDAELAYS
jgi:nucleotide-binding universal stress UspA family protein